MAEARAELGSVQRVEQRAPVQAVARGDEMHGVTHQVQPNHLALLGQGGQLARHKALQPGPQSHVRGEWCLRLHPGQVRDRVDRPHWRAVEQLLAGQRGPVEATLAEHLDHRSGPKNACRSAASCAGASIAGKCWPYSNSVQRAPGAAGTSLRTVASAPKTAKPCGTDSGRPRSKESAWSLSGFAVVGTYTNDQ